MQHIVIIPARNEEAHIAATLRSLLVQTLPPDRIYVVNDGSSDQTAEVVQSIANDYPCVQLLEKPDRGYRMMGGAVVETFNYAYAKCKDETFDYISKIDADVIFPPDYFEKLFAFMDANPDVAAASGVLFDHIGSTRQRLRCPDHHIGGPIKTIRKTVFDAMGGFVTAFGWDIVDQVKMRMLGYRTQNLPELEVEHQRQHGTAEGAWHGKATWGRGAWIIGSHPLFVLARAAYRMLEPPYILGGIALLYGYLKAAVTRVPQIDDKPLMAALRREQLYRLLHRNRLPEQKR